MSQKPILEVRDLRTSFHTERGSVTALHGINFQLREGEILGIVGESGCGKSVTSQSILRLYDEKYLVDYEGEINFQGKNILKLPMEKVQEIRGNEISMIFQDPLSSLNPVYTIGFQISESLMIHQKLSKKEATEKVIELLRLTGISAPEKRVKQYPHELSGGMRQRVMIAMALACKPRVLIADEPTTALDVTIQAQILDLILQLNKEYNMSVMFITHDLGVVAEICTRVIVMYLGQIVEETDVEILFSNPLHPYTKGLMKSMPTLEGDRSEKLHVIEGAVPSLNNIPVGCRFAERCPYADDLCRQEPPELMIHNENHKVRCWHYEKIEKGEVANDNTINV